MKKTNVRIFVIIIAAALLCAAYFGYDYFANRGEKVSYADFWQCVEAGDVTSVKFDGEKVFFHADAAGKDFVTDNPHSPLLAEELMKRGVEVTIVKDSAEIISLIFDAIFYLLKIHVCRQHRRLLLVA